MTGALAVPATEPDPVMRLVFGWLAAQESPHTRTAYARDLAGITPPSRTGARRPRPLAAPCWLGWCHDNGIDPITGVEPVHVALYARQLEDSPLARTSRARKLSAVSSFYSHLAESGMVAASPVTVRRPAVNRDARVAPGLTRAQAHAFMDAADGAPGPQRARTSALMATLVLTGARVSEAISADIADLGIDRGHRVLWVTRKGGKRQALALPGPAAERVDAYLAARSRAGTAVAERGQPGSPLRQPLFATATGGRLFPWDVWKLIRRLGERAGFPAELTRRLGPHALRATFITLSLDAGAPIRDVQDAAGHVSADTTRGYDRSRHNLDRAPGYALAAYLAAEDG